MGNSSSSVRNLVGGAGCHCNGDDKGGSSSQSGGYIVPSERKRASGRGITLKGKSRKAKSAKSAKSAKKVKKGGKPRTAKKTRTAKRARTAKAGRRHSRK